MDIRKLINESYVDKRNVNKADKSQTAPDSGETKGTEGKGTNLNVDKISISSTLAADGMDQARQAYKSLSSAQLDRVKQIKKQIERGEYDVNAALDKVTQRLASDLKGLEAAYLSGGASIETRNIDTKELLNRLDESIYQQVAQRLFSDLKNL